MTMSLVLGLTRQSVATAAEVLQDLQQGDFRNVVNFSTVCAMQKFVDVLQDWLQLFDRDPAAAQGVQLLAERTAGYSPEGELDWTFK